MAEPQGTKQRRGVGFFGWIKRLASLIFLGALVAGGYYVYQWYHESEVQKEIIKRLTDENRVAEVWVEDYQKNATGQVEKLKLKILEYGADDKPLKPVYCEFRLNDLIHFEAMVIRLNDDLIKEGKGKSVYLFRRAFALDDHGNTYEACDINRPMEIPGGYSLGGTAGGAAEVENRFWKSFWAFALDEKRRQDAGVKNAQIEAPATRFIPDNIYRLILQHNGGLYIQASPVPEILKGEKVKVETPGPSREAPR